MKTLLSFAGMLAALILTSTGTAYGVGASETNPAAIMQAVYARDEGDHAHARVEMVIKEQGGATKTRMMQLWWLNFEGGIKRLVMFETPSDIRNSGLLTYDYSAKDQADDQWLFLATLHRSTRITTANRSGAFMGSDLSYADIVKPEPRDYSFKLVTASEMVDGDDCWVIEGTPVSDTVRSETGYRTVQYWVSKQKQMILRQKLWLTDGQHIKYLMAEGVTKQAGVWTPKRVVARSMKAGKLESETVLSYLEVAYGQKDVIDSSFTKERLERGL